MTRDVAAGFAGRRVGCGDGVMCEPLPDSPA
jgi:hypothetical protein